MFVNKIGNWKIAYFTLFSAFIGVAEGKKCPSVCTRDTVACKQSGGNIVGYCVNGLACCDLTGKTTGSCGDVKKGDTINFQSPSYPNFHKNELLCTFSLALWEETVGIRLEFTEVVMDGLGFAGNGAGCDSDMFYFRGFKTWTPPPLCGNLTGYSTVIERTQGTTRMDQLTLVALMSSDKYRWRIKLSQIKPFNKKTKEKESKATTIQNADHNNILKTWTLEASSSLNSNALKDPGKDHSHLVSKMWGENNAESVEMFNNASAPSKRKKRNSTFDKIDFNRSRRAERFNGFDPKWNDKYQKNTTKVSAKYPEPDSENIFEEAQGQSLNSVGDQDDDDFINIEIPMIVNGQDTEIKEVPWQVSIRQKEARLPKSHKNISASTLEEDEDEDGVIDTEPDLTTAIPSTSRGNSDNVTLDLNSNKTGTTATTTTSSPDFSDLSSTTKSEPEMEPEVPARNCSAEEGSHFCGGSIISDRHILTAAHCFHGSTKLRGMEQLDTLKVILGDTDACTRDLPEPGTPPTGNLTEQEHEIETVFIHYAYDNIALLNDVAVIKLRRPIQFSGGARPIKMAAFGAEFDGKEALASGWGMKNLTDKSAELPYILQSSHRFLVRNASECHSETERLFGAPLANVTKHPKYEHAFKSLLCTDTTVYSNASGDGEAKKKDSSRGEVLVGPGDSGGPLVSEGDEGELVLIGIVSYGIPPEGAKGAGEYIDFFQSVAYFRNWIELAMQS